MPRMTGFELVHALKRDPELRDIPIMMLTARDTRRDQAQMRAVGLTSYLVKPFSVDKCVAMVERVLAERRLLAYKEASRLYISDGAVRAAEDAARRASDTLQGARRGARDGRAVLRHLRLHQHVVEAAAARGGRAAQRASST